MSEEQDPPVLHRGISKTRCGSCKQEIVWAFHPTTQKNAPFQVDPQGAWEIINGTALYRGVPKAQSTQLELGVKPVDPPPRYTSHFSACPQRAEWRK